MQLLTNITLFVALAGAVGCGRRDRADAVPIDCGAPVGGLEVVPVGPNGQSACEGDVTATEGLYAEHLQRRGCVFWGAFDRPGTYAVVAQVPPFEPVTVQDVVVKSAGDGCHVTTQQVTVPLQARQRWFPHGLLGMPAPVCEPDRRPQCWCYCQDPSTKTARCVNPRVVWGQVEVSEPARPREILGLTAGFLDCYHRALFNAPDLRGSVTIVAEVTPGAMPSARLGSTHELDASFTACLVRSVQAHTIEPPPSGRATMTIPLTFERE